MNTSPTIGAIAKALAAAQREIGVAHKDATNPHFRSRYADLQAIDEACRPILSKHGIAISQAAGYLEGLASITTRLMHADGEWIEATLHVPVSKHDAQGVGSALTYARRFGLSALAAVPAGIDDDGEAAVGRGAPRGEVAVPPPATVIPFEPPARAAAPAPAGDLPEDPPELYPLAFSPLELRPVWKVRELGTDGKTGGRTKVYYADAVGIVTKLTEGGGPKSPTSVILWSDPNRTRFSTFRRWTIPEGMGSTVRLKGVTRTEKNDAVYWNFETVEAYKPDHDAGVDIDLPF
jgi:hypothetical protein